LADAPPALADALRDRYVLERELGRGGMATVYLAHDVKYDRSVALKVLHPELAASLGAERFQREIRTAARLQHPHILTVLDSGEAAGQLWFTMPYVEGESLRDRLNRERQLPLEDALRIGREAGEALEYAHRHGVIHRDIKPENLLLTNDGNMLVADFGIARALTGGDEQLTRTGVSLGTPTYMSPEQATGDASLDGRSDLYSLGCVLYEMLAGEPPFTGATPQSILAKRLATTAAPLSVVRLGMPTNIVNAVERALRQSPTDRFRTVSEFVAALATVAVATPRDDSRTTPATTLSPASIWARSAQLRWLTIVAIALLVGLVGVWAALARHRSSGALARPAPRSIAVLPLANVGGDTTNEYFADGISEELASALGKVPGLRVAARTSAFTFKGKNPTPQEIRDRLHVAAFLTGSVRRAGTMLRVTTELVNVQDGLTLWTETYEREIRDVRDVFQVQDDIAHAVVAALGVLNAGTGAPLVHRTTVSAEAHDLYLKGRFAWNRRTRVALQRAAQYFEQAIALDSGYADAFAGLADALVLLPQYGGAEPRVAWPQARIAAERALALDSTLAEAHASLAYGQFQHEWKWDDAEGGFRRALALDPNYATGHQWYGDYLDGRGRLQEGLEEFKRAQQLDPLSRVIGIEVAWGSYRLHRYDEAVSAIKLVLRLDPNFGLAHLTLGLAYLQEGLLRQAVEELQQGVALSDRDPRAVAGLSCAYAALRRRDSAVNLLAELKERSAREYVPPSTLAMAYASLGDFGNAFRWISRGVEEHDAWLVEDFFDPLLDPLRSDPRFQPVARSLGLK